jgi:hypothetical protein
MHLDWSADQRPRWWFGCSYEVGSSVRPVDRCLAFELERGLCETGEARAPRVVVRQGQLDVVVLVRAVDDLEAAVVGLTVLDLAVARLGGLVLGELRGYRTTGLVGRRQ